MLHRGLNKLSEELNELGVVVAKLTAYPRQEMHPDGSHQLSRLQEEIADVLACIDYVSEAWDLHHSAIQDRRAAKLKLYKIWTHEASHGQV